MTATPIYVTVIEDLDVAATALADDSIAVTIQPSVGIAVTVLSEGIPGTPGLAGASGASFAFDQNVGASTWNVTHNLGYFPAVTVVDTLLREVVADVQHVDVNNLTIHFATPNTGHAFCS